MIKFPKLFEPGKIGKLEVKNRIIFPPIVTLYTDKHGNVTDRLVEYCSERAKGGAGIIVTEAMYPRASGYPGRIYLNDDKYIPGLAKLTEAIHRGGAKAVCEINPHRGRADEGDPASASAGPHPYKPGVMAREITRDDIKVLIESFGQGVRRAREAGYDAIMIHGATGYLISEFLSPRVNRRTDEYGGDIKGRGRFALELVKETRKVLGSDFPLIIRIMVDERIPGGLTIKDGVVLCRLLEEAGVDSIDIMTGCQDTPEWILPPSYLPSGCNADFSQLIKKAVKIPISVVGRINDPYIAEDILEKGKADFVAMGRALIADPYLPQKAQEGRVEEIRKCISCQRCGATVILEHLPLTCSVNPEVGSEHEFAIKTKPAASKKKVIVVGGGPGGMQAAVVAAKRGHDVTLWENSGKLGGQLIVAKVPPGKDNLDTLIEYLKTQMTKLKVKVELNKEATASSINKLAPDAVIVAAGSIPNIPNIPGINGKNVINGREVLADPGLAGNKVLIIGGGLIGCETADFLVEKGKKVTMAFPEAAPMSLEVIDRSIVKVISERLTAGNVAIFPGIRKFQEISSEGIRVIDRDGNPLFLAADTIILATGSKPNKSLAQSLKGITAEIYEVGDCFDGHRIADATREGSRAALEI